MREGKHNHISSQTNVAPLIEMDGGRGMVGVSIPIQAGCSHRSMILTLRSRVPAAVAAVALRPNIWTARMKRNNKKEQGREFRGSDQSG